MIKIKLAPYEKDILEWVFFEILSTPISNSKKIDFYKVSRNTEIHTRRTEILCKKNMCDLKYLEKKYKNSYAKYEKKCSYIKSNCFQKQKNPQYEFAYMDIENMRKFLVSKPWELINTSFSSLDNEFWKGVKTLVDICWLNYHCTDDKDILVNWIRETEEHYKSIFEFFRSIDSRLAEGYNPCIQMLATNRQLRQEIVKQLKEVVNFIDALFDYEDLITGTPERSYYITSFMKTPVCPYCNRQYISVLNDTKKSLATFDHYYRKEMYPIFKISLYNLIPSCYGCNTKLKSTSDLEHLNPWHEGDKKMYFSIGMTGNEGLDYLLNYYQDYGSATYTEQKIDIVAVDNDPHTLNSINTFSLKDMYQIHNQEAHHLKIKAQKYEGGDYKKTLLEHMKSIEGSASTNLVDTFIYGFPTSIFESEEEDKYFSSMPLYKLKKDIIVDVIEKNQNSR